MHLSFASVSLLSFLIVALGCQGLGDAHSSQAMVSQGRGGSCLKKNYCLCDDMRERVNMVAGIGCLHVLGGVVIEIFVQEVFSKILLFFSSVFGSGLPCR